MIFPLLLFFSMSLTCLLAVKSIPEEGSSRSTKEESSINIKANSNLRFFPPDKFYDWASFCGVSSNLLSFCLLSSFILSEPLVPLNKKTITYALKASNQVTEYSVMLKLQNFHIFYSSLKKAGLLEL